MKTIWKFDAHIILNGMALSLRTDEFTIKMPKGAKVLSVQMQYGEPRLWVLVDDTQPLESREFYWRGTGHNCDGVEPGSFVGTVQMQGGDLIFHLFERGRA